MPTPASEGVLKSPLAATIYQVAARRRTACPPIPARCWLQGVTRARGPEERAIDAVEGPWLARELRNYAPCVNGGLSMRVGGGSAHVFAKSSRSSLLRKVDPRS